MQGPALRLPPAGSPFHAHTFTPAGVRLEPISWRELAAVVADGSERALGALGRTPPQIKGYWDYRDRVILQENASGRRRL